MLEDGDDYINIEEDNNDEQDSEESGNEEERQNELEYAQLAELVELRDRIEQLALEYQSGLEGIRRELESLREQIARGTADSGPSTNHPWFRPLFNP